MKTKIALFLGLIFVANVSYADLKIGFVNIPAVLEKEIQNKKRDAKRSQQEFSEDFNASRNEELGKLQRRIVEAVRAIAKDEDYDLLLTDGVIYAKDQFDITAQVQKKLSTMPE